VRQRRHAPARLIEAAATRSSSRRPLDRLRGFGAPFEGARPCAPQSMCVDSTVARMPGGGPEARSRSKPGDLARRALGHFPSTNVGGRPSQVLARHGGNCTGARRDGAPRVDASCRSDA
jgi:hypothetical protein